MATFINNQFPSEEILITTNLEVIAVKITTKSRVTICNIYLPNSQDFNSTEIQPIIDQLSTPFIILGDFNFHNILWGCSDTDHRGTIIESILNANNINILNNGQATRVSTNTGNFSAIDISFSFTTITPKSEWERPILTLVFLYYTGTFK